MRNRYTSIQITPEARDRLKFEARKSQTYSEFIVELCVELCDLYKQKQGD